MLAKKAYTITIGLLLACFGFAKSVLADPFVLGESAPVLYAKELFNEASVRGNTRFVVSAGDELEIDIPVGFGISGNPFIVSVTFENARFGESLPGTGVNPIAGLTSLLLQGGTIDDSHALIEVKASPALPESTRLTLPIGAMRWDTSADSVNVRYALYESASDALYDAQPIVEVNDTYLKTEFATGTHYSQNFTHYSAFNQQFLRFVPSFRSPSAFALGDANETLASLAYFDQARLINGEFRNPVDSSIVTDSRDLLQGINTDALQVTLEGEFAVNTLFLNTDDDCSGTSFELGQDNPAVFSLDTLYDYPVLCVQALSNEQPIQASRYTLDLGIGLGEVPFGEIKHDAAVVDLPYVTNFASYRQRILLTNHAGFDVSYQSRVVSEELLEGEFEPGVKASGVIPSGTTLMIDSRDLVIINSGQGLPSRVSARIFIDAQPYEVSAAVQILELGSTAPPMTNVLEVKD